MRFPKNPTALLPLTLLVALVAAGCGGGGGDTSTTTAKAEVAPTLSKQELISQGDAICAEVNAAVGTVGESEAEVPSQITQVAGLYTGMVERLKSLGTPEDEAGYPEFIAAAEKLAAIEDEAKLAAERADTTAVGEAATKAAPALEEFESTAGAYGFKDCSEGPSAPATTPAGAESGEEAGAEAAPEAGEEAGVEEAAPEEVAPESGGAGIGTEEGGTESGGGGGGPSGNSGGVGPG
jgi:hypothetical protein